MGRLWFVDLDWPQLDVYCCWFLCGPPEGFPEGYMLRTLPSLPGVAGVGGEGM